MSTLNKSDLHTEVTSEIRTGNSDTSAAGLRQSLNDIIESYVNVIDGGLLYQSQVGYSFSPITLNANAFVSKAFMIDYVSSLGLVSPTLFQTLSNNNKTGGIPITSDNLKSLTSIGESANLMQFEEGSELGVININAGATIIQHTTENRFDSPNNNFPQETPSKIAVFDASGNLKSGGIDLGGINLQFATDNGNTIKKSDNTTNLLEIDRVNDAVNIIGDFYSQTNAGAEIYSNGAVSYMSADAQTNTNLEVNLSAIIASHNVEINLNTPIVNISGDTKTNSIYLSDSANGDYGHLTIDDSKFIVTDYLSAILFGTDDSVIYWQNSSNNFTSTIGNTNIATNRVYQLPDADGTIALLSNITGLYLPLAGNTISTKFTGQLLIDEASSSQQFYQEGFGYHAYLSLDVANPSLSLELSDPLNTTGCTIVLNTTGILIYGYDSLFSGLNYNSDYSANYTNRSLVDKGYVLGLNYITLSSLIDGAPIDADTLNKLNNKILAIQTLLSSDNVNLDTVQELVDAIETLQLSFSTILVDDLVTGGTTKALTAQQGVVLKGLIDTINSTIANFETTTQLNNRDTANRNRANHTGVQLANTISDFQSTVSANTDVTANTLARHTHSNLASLNLVSGTNTGDENTNTIGSLINNATAKTTPVDADYIGLMDSAASNILKKLSWLNIKATLKTYFDTLYQPLLATLTSWGAITRASGFDTFVTTPNSANLLALVTDGTGSGALVFGTAPTLSNPIVGTQSQNDNSTKASSTAYVDLAISNLQSDYSNNFLLMGA